jgi:hypothetical protein
MATGASMKNADDNIGEATRQGLSFLIAYLLAQRSPKNPLTVFAQLGYQSFSMGRNIV